MNTVHRKVSAFAAALLLLSTANPAAQLPASAFLRGDVTGDGLIKADDAQKTLEAYTIVLTGQPSPLTDEETEAADVDFNGKIAAEDAQFILLYYTANTVSGTPTDWFDLIDGERPANKIPDADDMLTIVCWGNSDFEKMKAHFENAHPEYKDKIQIASASSYSAQSVEAYPKYLAGPEDADIIICEADYIRQFSEGDTYCLPVTDLGFKESDFNKCFDYTKEIGRDSQGVLKGVAPFAYPGGYLYRTDLAEQYLGAKSPEEMQKFVDSWEHFTQTAAKVREGSGGRTAMTATLYGMMFPWMYQRTQPWLDETGTLQITGNDLAFSALLRTFYDNGYVTDAQEWTEEWYAAGQDDSTLGYFAAPWWLIDGETGVLGRAEGGKNGSTYGKYAFTEGPAPFFWGGYYMLLSKKCNTGTLAHDFVEHFTVNTETMRDYAEQYGEFVNNEIAMQDIERSNPLLGGINEIPTLLKQAKAVDLWGVRGPYDEDLCWDYLLAARDAAEEGQDDADMLEHFKMLAIKEHPDIKLG